MVFRAVTMSAVALTGVLSLVGACAGDTLYFQGFETDSSGWYEDTGGNGNGAVLRQESGAGALALAAFDGSYYAELHNNTNAYLPGYGTGGYSLFGNLNTLPPYPGSPVAQSLTVYVNPATPAPSDVNAPAVRVDMAPSSSSPSDAASGGIGYGGEHTFNLFYSGRSVTVETDDAYVLATLTSAGWYTFEMIYSRGASGGSLAYTTLDLFGATGTLLGVHSIADDSNGDPLQSQYLEGPGYVAVTAWQNGFADDRLAIDDVRADSIPEPSTGLLLIVAAVPVSWLAKRFRAGSVRT